MQNFSLLHMPLIKMILFGKQLNSRGNLSGDTAGVGLTVYHIRKGSSETFAAFYCTSQTWLGKVVKLPVSLRIPETFAHLFQYSTKGIHFLCEPHIC